MANATGEMPFLDHLEELRKRILLSLAGIMAGFGIGWWLTTHFNLIQAVEAPIAPLLPSGKLAVMSPTDPFMIVLKFAFLLGLVLSSPFVIYQLWLFLSPALTTREKRAIVPSLGIGLLLFLGGAALGWLYVVGPAVVWLLNFQAGTFNPVITMQSYMQLVVHVLVGMGIAAELPLIMIVLALLDVMSYRMYRKFRRYAFFLAFVGGAILAPTPEITMMILFTIPLLLLYEVGVAGAWLIERRRARVARLAAGAMVIALCMIPHRLHAQVPPAPPPAVVPTAPGAPGAAKISGTALQMKDTSALKRLGLPVAPRRNFGTDDSIMQALLAKKGFASTRYTGDSASFDVIDQRILLHGHAATLRDGSQLEADQINYDGPRCFIEAQGEPQAFQPRQQAMIGVTMHLNICADSSRAVIDDAMTALAERGANWFVRGGHLAVDSGGKRLFGASTEFTSCDLPDPHYHFSAGKVKWVSQSIMVARPAVLFVRDVPVFWLPFIFQDTKRDRSSGILIPKFGFNDIVRNDKNYNRQVTNVGYYWAPSDYFDATGSLDWYANRYIQFGGRLNYRWLDRFVTGSLSLSKQVQSNGVTNNILSWNHDQRIDVTTSLHFSLNYQSSSTVLLNNAVDPLTATRQITSNLNLTKKYPWGVVTLGGVRSQALGGGAGQMSFPSITISPRAFNIGSHVNVTPNFSVSNQTSFNNPLTVPLPFTFGGIDSLAPAQLSSQRTTNVTLTLPTVLFGLTLNNSVQYQDQVFNGRFTVSERLPVSPGSTDSITRKTVRAGNYETGFDWTTGLNLPLVLPTTWKVTPSIVLSNISPGPYLVRSAASDGAWVSQGKRITAGLSAAPTFFAFTRGGIGSFQRLRYTLAPTLSISWSPASSVSQAFAEAAGSIGGSAQADIPSRTVASVNFHQVLEGKTRPAASDTNTDPVHLASLPKKQLLSISTSQIAYDFDQAKLPHRTGWQTGVLTNSFTSDMIPGLTVSTTHDLFQGDFTSDTAKFSPFLSNMNASFSVTGRTFHSIGRFLHLVRRDSIVAAPTVAPIATSPLALAPSMSQYRPAGGAPVAMPRAGFNAAFNFSYSAQRPIGSTLPPVSTDPTIPGMPLDPYSTGLLTPILTPPPQSQLGLTMSFSPTQFWTVSWNTQYDITHGTFQSHQIHLQRDLHDWRASFDFTKGPNGNFALYFSMFLINLPDIKFDYNQTTLQQAPIQP